MQARIDIACAVHGPSWRIPFNSVSPVLKLPVMRIAHPACGRPCFPCSAALSPQAATAAATAATSSTNGAHASTPAPAPEAPAASAASTSRTPLQDGMRRKLTEALKPSTLTIIDESAQHAGHAAMMVAKPGKAGGPGETHFKVEVVSEAFEGLTQVKRQRMVYQVSGRPGGGDQAGYRQAQAPKSYTPLEVAVPCRANLANLCYGWLRATSWFRITNRPAVATSGCRATAPGRRVQHGLARAGAGHPHPRGGIQVRYVAAGWEVEGRQRGGSGGQCGC